MYKAYTISGMGHKKFPFFETRYHATVILHSVFISVPFYNFLCFYCCVSIFKVRRKEQLKNGKKNGAKNGVKMVQCSVFFPLPFFLTIFYLSACTSIKTSKSLDDSLKYLPSAAVSKFLSYAFHVIGEVKFGAWCSR